MDVGLRTLLFWKFRGGKKDVGPCTLYNHHERTLRYLTKKHLCVLAVVPVLLPRFDFYLFLFRDFLFGGRRVSFEV